MTDLEQRVQKLENRFWVATAVAIIFGFSGAYGYKELGDAQKQLARLQNGVAAVRQADDEALLELEKAKQAQIADIQRDARPLVKQAITDQMETEIGKTKYWTAYVYFKAAQIGRPPGGGCNGWWQNDLIGKSDVVARDLGMQEQLK